MTTELKNRPNLWLDLSRKFQGNLELAIAKECESVSAAEIQCRGIPIVAKILANGPPLQDWQSQGLCMFDEIFADITCSIYLAGCGLDKPAQAILRRALELGVATVYLWDLPHVFWRWSEHDSDLNFNDMLEHLADAGYLSFVRKQNKDFVGPELLDSSLARKLYRDLSNIVHGKIASFECLLPDRFDHNEADWKSHLGRVRNVEHVLFQLWQNRFATVTELLQAELPQLRMNKTGQI